MKRLLITTSLALASVAAPAHAQLLGGGGGLGGMVNVPGGAIGGAGNIGIDRAGTAIDGGADATVTRGVRAPRVANVQAATNANLVAPAVNAPRVIVLNVSTVGTVRVPQVANVRVREAAIVAGGITAIPVNQVPYYVDSQYTVFENELRGTGARVTRHGNQIIIEMPADVTFAFNKADIRPRFMPSLNALARTLNRYPATFIDVEGHTDAIGSYGYNQSLSERRAGEVAGFLADRAVLSGRMHTQGFGKTEPVASNATIEGRAANRRVEIVLTPYSG